MLNLLLCLRRCQAKPMVRIVCLLLSLVLRWIEVLASAAVVVATCSYQCTYCWGGICGIEGGLKK